MTSVRPRPGRPAGVYLHIPFCAQLCPYCDFAVSVRRDIPHRAYADALIAEGRRRLEAGELLGRDVSTVYLGGGTPTLLDVAQLERVARFLIEEAQVGDAEWSFEANPIDLTQDVAASWRELGFDRVSLGIQSFDDAYLKRLGRQHDGAGAHRALHAAFDAGFDVSFDLIFAGPKHDQTTWEEDLSVVEALPRVDHVSAYHLTVEPNTVFARRAARGALDLPDDETAVAMLVSLRDVCRARGVEQYEVSSYAAPGKRSRHNTHYWTGNEYVGLGVGAHGLIVSDEVVRTTNTRRLRDYLESPADVREQEVLDPYTHLAERAFTGLRSAAGVEFDAMKEQFGSAIDAATWDRLWAALHRIVEQGWLRERDGHLSPTDKGFLFADLAGEWVYEAVMDG